MIILQVSIHVLSIHVFSIYIFSIYVNQRLSYMHRRSPYLTEREGFQRGRVRRYVAAVLQLCCSYVAAMLPLCCSYVALPHREGGCAPYTHPAPRPLHTLSPLTPHPSHSPCPPPPSPSKAPHTRHKPKPPCPLLLLLLPQGSLPQAPKQP